MARKANQPDPGALPLASLASLASPTSADASATPDQPAAPLTRFQAGRTVVMNRSALKAAPWNPRQISTAAKKLLRAEIKKHGYLDRIVLNERSGQIVRGHQRISILDDLNGSKEYSLEVTVVDMDEATEAAANISGNNTTMQGEYNLPLLEKVIKEKKIKPEDMGFSAGDVYRMFGASPLMAQPEAMRDLADKVREAEARYKQIKDIHKDQDGEDYYAVMVFRDHAERKRWLDHFRVPDVPDCKAWVDGRSVLGEIDELRGKLAMAKVELQRHGIALDSDEDLTEEVEYEEEEEAEQETAGVDG